MASLNTISLGFGFSSAYGAFRTPTVLIHPYTLSSKLPISPRQQYPETVDPFFLPLSYAGELASSSAGLGCKHWDTGRYAWACGRQGHPKVYPRADGRRPFLRLSGRRRHETRTYEATPVVNDVRPLS